MNHTPGPWNPSNAEVGSVEIHDESGTLIADVMDRKDARLIALAPEMLEVVREAAHCAHCVCGTCPPASCDTSEKAKAILKKLEVNK